MILFLTVAVLAAATLLVWWSSSKESQPTRESFLVSDRLIPFRWGITTVLANWVQAPALLLSGMFAYQGTWYFLVFLIPNVLALVLMGVLAPRIQDTLPRGYTLPQCMGEVYGAKVRTLFFFLAFMALVAAIGYTLTGLRQWFGTQLGISPMEMTLVLGAYAVLCVMPRGLQGAVIGDAIKIAVVGLLALGVVYLHVFFVGAPAQLATEAPSLGMLSPEMVFWTIGIPLAASLIGGPICNPDLAERSYALKRNIVRQAYFWAAGIFGLTVIVFGSLGILAKNLGMKIMSPSVPAFQVLQTGGLSPEITIVVSIALMVILGAALASFLASTGDLVVIEFYQRFINPSASDQETIWFGRAFMVIPILIGTYIASIPKVDISIILQSMGVIRGETIIPVILAVFVGRSVSARAVFVGMLCGAIGGFLLTFGPLLSESLLGEKNLFLAAHGKPLGALFAVFAPLVVVACSFAVSNAKKGRLKGGIA
jgi:Na+/proline symporter